jgi:hypothetical protein
MNKADVTGWFCGLASKVGSEVFNDQEPHDCFCGDNPVSDANFRMDKRVLDFIGQAVNEKIIKQMKNTAHFEGVWYTPILFQADSDELAKGGKRLIIHHGTACSPETRVYWAAKGNIVAGWAIGISAEPLPR